VLVSGDESNGRAEFYFCCNVGRCGITYLGGITVAGVFNDIDLQQLRGERFVTLVRLSGNGHRGKPTQRGIDAVRNRSSGVPNRVGRPTRPSPLAQAPPNFRSASSVPSPFEKRLMKEYEDRLPQLGSREIERLQLHGIERIHQLANKIEIAEKQHRDRTEELTQIKGKAVRKAAQLAIHQEATTLRGEVRLAAAIIAADTVREFAYSWLLTQRRLAADAMSLRDYTGRLIRKVRVRMTASELFAAEVPIPLSDDPIAQSSMRTCEEIIGANKKKDRRHRRARPIRSGIRFAEGLGSNRT